MSGCTALYRFDRQPIDRNVLRRMSDACAHRGPDGSGYWVDGEIGLAHRMLWATPEALQEVQPFVDNRAQLALVLDGRIDNREELNDGIRAAGFSIVSDTDAELVLRAYEAWGESCPSRLLGDFVFVLWDGRRRVLFAARDPLGIKPFVYHADETTFRGCSELHQLSQDPLVQLQPNEGMIGEYLAGAITSPSETLYRNVLRLPPGHALTAGPNGVRVRRYWTIDPGHIIRYQREKDYAEHLASLLREAVRCRLRGYGRVGAYLSGGLDSSSVVATAQALFRAGSARELGFETFSLCFPGRACDESRYADDVVRLWGLKSNRAMPEEAPRHDYAVEVARYLDIPDYPNGAMVNVLRERAKTKGFRVLLTGLGGDDWLTGSSYHYADLLRDIRLVELIRQVRFDRRIPETAIVRTPSRFLRFGVIPLIPSHARRTLKRLLRKNRSPVPEWIEPLFARRVALADRLAAVPPAKGFPSLAQEDLYRTAFSGFNIHCLEIVDRSEARYGIEARHPLHDRRIVEFALAIPEDQRWRRDQIKFVLREALGDRLPSSVRNRLDKAEFSHVFADSLQAVPRRFFERLSIGSSGWIRTDRVQALHERMTRRYAAGDAQYSKNIWALWLIVGIEEWSRVRLESRPALLEDVRQRVADAEGVKGVERSGDDQRRVASGTFSAA